MMERFRIKGESPDDMSSMTELEVKDYLDSIQENRARIRNLASMIIAVCGMLLSASFVIMFFLIEKKIGSPVHVVFVLLFIVIALLMLSLAFSIASAYVTKPKSASTHGEKLKVQLGIYRQERLYLTLCTFTLFGSVLMFLIAVVVFLMRLGLA